MAPAPPVLRVRSKSGCLTCRRRKKKCDERKPTCTGCHRNALSCQWPAASSSLSKNSLLQLEPTITGSIGSLSPEAAKIGPSQVSLENATLGFSSFLDGQDFFGLLDPLGGSLHELTAQNLLTAGFEDVATVDQIAERPGQSSSVHLSNSLSPLMASVESQGRPTCSNFPGDTDCLGSIPDFFSSCDDGNTQPSTRVPFQTEDYMLPTRKSQSGESQIHQHPSLFPNLDQNSSELFSFYLSATANKMGNGSTESNPFVVNVVPMAFSEPLIFQLIIAQSSVHRQVSIQRRPAKQLSERYYDTSLQLFRREVEGALVRKGRRTLPLAMGSLTLSLTEVARGDCDGSTYDHIMNAKGLLRDLLLDTSNSLPDYLSDFLVEYYCHMSVLTMIGMGSRLRDGPSVDMEIVDLGNKLAEKNYVGQLVGCWLPIILLLPQIYSLGQRMARLESNPHSIQLPEDIINFGHIQSQILSFTPPFGTHPDTALAALVFKKAALLYLWTILGMPHGDQDDNNKHQNLINAAAVEALSLLEQIPTDSRINTSLCWPLSVIGCCISSPTQEQAIRDRLLSMFDAMALGGVRQTAELLEKTWALPLSLRSPWCLGRVMKENDHWISLA